MKCLYQMHTLSCHRHNLLDNKHSLRNRKMPFMKLLKSRCKLEPFWTPANTFPYFNYLLIHRLFLLLLTCNRSNLDLFEARIFPDILPDVNPRKTQGYWVFSLRHQIQDFKYFLASLWLKILTNQQGHTEIFTRMAYDLTPLRH